MQPGASSPRASHATTPIDPVRRRRAWDEAPLAVKTSVLVGLAATLGLLTGLVESALGHRVWPLVLGHASTLLLVGWLGRRWVRDPIEELLWTWSLAARQQRLAALDRLPITRTDEVGRLARALHQSASTSLRQSADAQQLRRTLDHRVAQATRQATTRLRLLTMRDPLTDLGNRRFLEENLPALVGSALDSGTPLTCAVVDLDDFKPVNDRLGHAAGDQLLVLLATLLRGSIRREDFAVRLGGDEFLVLLPNCREDRARQVLDHVRVLFRQQARILLPAGSRVDLSVGVASLPAAGVTNGTELVARADAHLYAAKRDGKGRTVTASAA